MKLSKAHGEQFVGNECRCRLADGSWHIFTVLFVARMGLDSLWPPLPALLIATLLINRLWRPIAYGRLQRALLLPALGLGIAMYYVVLFVAVGDIWPGPFFWALRPYVSWPGLLVVLFVGSCTAAVASTMFLGRGVLLALLATAFAILILTLLQWIAIRSVLLEMVVESGVLMCITAGLADAGRRRSLPQRPNLRLTEG